MFVQLHASLTDPTVVPLLPQFFGDLLTAHRIGSIILLLNPAEAGIIRASADLGYADRLTLDRISEHYADYEAASAIAKRKILAVPHEIERFMRIEGSTALVSVQLLVANYLSTQSFFLAEHLRDVYFIDSLVERVNAVDQYPANFIKYRPVLGGGSALADTLENEDCFPKKGILICDRDTAADVPPFKAGRPGRAAYERAKTLNLLHEAIGCSPTSPSFTFLVTWGRSIENYVGPNLLLAHLGASENRDCVTAFHAAFSNFPKLNDHETVVWRYLDLKNGTPLLNEVYEQLRAEFGAVPAAIVAKAAAYSELRVPPACIGWVIQNRAATQFTPKIRTAVESDLRNGRYGAALRELAYELRAYAAGDRGAMF